MSQGLPPATTRGENGRELERSFGPPALAATVGVVDVALLLWVGVEPARLAVFAVLLVAAGLAGALCLRGREALFGDRFGFAVAAVTVGLALHMVLCYVLFHARLANALGIHGRRESALAALAILSALGAVSLVSARRRLVALPAVESPWSASLVFALASLVAGATHFGFGNDLTRLNHMGGEVNSVVVEFFGKYAESESAPNRRTVPEWGSRVDSLIHVWLIPRTIEEHGLPDAFFGQTSDTDHRIGEFQHVGAPVQILGLADAAGTFGARSAAASSKPLALAWLVLVGAWIFLTARRHFGLSARVALLAVAGGLFFAALDVRLISGERAGATHVLTYVSGPLYWNLNQVAQLAVGLGGLFLVLRALQGRERTFALGCALVACSVLYKPSFFFVAAPAIGLASLRLERSCLRADVVLGWLALAAAVGFWFGYPRLMEVQRIASPIGFRVLELQAQYAREAVLPASWLARLSPAGVKATIVLLATAAWVVPCAYHARRLWRVVLARPDLLAACLLLAWGLFTAWCFVEDVEDVGRRLSNNHFFGGAAAYTACMPLLVLAIQRIESRAWRTAAWSVYAAHLASGAMNLWLYASAGRLV